MLIKIEELKKMDDFKQIDDRELERKINSIEVAIREHTHNNFQVREARCKGASFSKSIIGWSPYFKIGDTVEISQSVNKGLYIITEISENNFILDKELFEVNGNLVTKVVYPDDIVEGAIALLKWDVAPNSPKHKIGISSESNTLSRHSKSKSYKSYDKTNTIKGYPAELFGFCTPYMKMRI